MRIHPLLFALVLVLALIGPRAAPAEERGRPIFGAAAGINGLWYDAEVSSLPSSFEAGVSAKASLTPHISGVAAGYYGFKDAYLRGSAGVRLTATDVQDPNFSIGLGGQYQFSNDVDLRPREWMPDVTVGWRPYPATLPKVILGASAGYGVTTKRVQAIAAVRYALIE